MPGDSKPADSRPGESSAVELARVAADAAAGRALHDPAATAAERVCTQTVELLVRSGGHADDITLLAAQRTPAVPDLVLDLPAVPAALRDARARLATWLAALGAAEHDTLVLQHALGELATNAIEHASDQTTIAVRAKLTADGVVEATVADRGGWRPPERRPTRGRGLALAAQLVRSLRVDPGPAGTLATVRHPLTRPARLLGTFDDTPMTAAAPAEPAVAQPPAAELTITELPGGDETRVRLDGPVDAASAAHVRQELLRRSRGGSVPMTVDLTGVIHLASAGVSVLHLVSDSHREEAALTLIAPPGSPAREILDLVGLRGVTP